MFRLDSSHPNRADMEVIDMAANKLKTPNLITPKSGAESEPLTWKADFDPTVRALLFGRGYDVTSSHGLRLDKRAGATRS